tara:strand:- start:2160 stop:3551 length:1392 start_codon:yes stop_codon:yes gene_type:complete
MSLDLLREKFGHSVSKDKKIDNRERIHERLNNKFNLNDMNNITSLGEQHQEQLDKKQRIIENLEAETSELANEVLTLEKEKAEILEELNKSKWMENNVALTTKKMYEDKIKKIVDEFESSHINSSKIIPLLTAVSRKRQGNKKLNWGDWLKIPENRYLQQIDENIAKKIFEDTNDLIDRNVNYINKKRRNYGGDVVLDYNLKFGGAEGNRAFVQTGFLPEQGDEPGVNLRLGFTVSYWVRPDEVGDTMFALGRKHNNNQRFTFGINTNKAIYVGVGGQRIRTTWVNMGATTNSNLSHLFNADNSLKTGNWINFVITYANRTEEEKDAGDNAELKLYMNGELIRTVNTDWSQGGGNTAGLMLGARNLAGGKRNEPSTPGIYNNGWSCGLDEVAIYDTGKGTSFAQEVYNGKTNYDHTGASNLVAYWKMNEGSGNTVIDHSGNGNNGTLETDGTGLPTWEEIKGY